MSKLVDFILKNQNNMIQEVQQNIIGLFYIREKLIIIKPTCILIDSETRFEIQIDKILDVVELQYKTYILASNEDKIMLIIYEEEEIKYFYKSLSLKYSQILINTIEDEQLMIMDCLIINNDLASILQINIFDYQIVDLRQAKQILRFSKDQILLVNDDEYYILCGNEISEFAFHDKINNISVFNGQTYIQANDSFYLIQDDQLIQTSLKQNSFVQNGLVITINENGFEIDTQGQIYQFHSDLQFSNQDRFVLQMNNEYPLVYILSKQSLYCIYYPDYQRLIESQFKQENITKEQKQITIDISQNEDLLFNHIKKQRTIIDDMINLCLRKGYLKPLLLLNARIRVYTTFFDQVVKTQNIRDIQKLIDHKIFKQCEMFEKQYMHEEFVEGTLKYQKYDSTVFFIKYLTENPQYVPEHLYLEILQIPFNRKLYLEKQLTPPNIPVYGFKMQLYRIKLLKQARQLCYHDYYRIKAEYIEMNEWFIDEQMLKLWKIIYRQIVDCKISEV